MKNKETKTGHYLGHEAKYAISPTIQFLHKIRTVYSHVTRTDCAHHSRLFFMATVIGSAKTFFLHSRAYIQFGAIFLLKTGNYIFSLEKEERAFNISRQALEIKKRRCWNERTNQHNGRRLTIRSQKRICNCPSPAQIKAKKTPLCQRNRCSSFIRLEGGFSKRKERRILPLYFLSHKRGTFFCDPWRQSRLFSASLHSF